MQHVQQLRACGDELSGEAELLYDAAVCAHIRWLANQLLSPAQRVSNAIGECGVVTYNAVSSFRSDSIGGRFSEECVQARDSVLEAIKRQERIAVGELEMLCRGLAELERLRSTEHGDRRGGWRGAVGGLQMYCDARCPRACILNELVPMLIVGVAVRPREYMNIRMPVADLSSLCSPR